ncbi:MAG: response regulator [Candidatus Galacturonibacter soehngenii]|nr:response regulator [Candidatus Galacturonibacter soehngenii]
MNYRVLIVDDEPGIAEGISFLIERLMPECQVIGITFDGQQGIQKALSLKPDIILTDIRMPEIDGLEMIRKLKENGFQSRFIILSGFAEFKYARTAITLGVEEYITKPIEEEELVSVLSRTCKLVNEEKKKQEQEQQMEQTIRGYTLKDILESSEVPLSDIKSRLQNLGFPVTYKDYVCAVVEKNAKIIKDTNIDFAVEINRAIEQYFDFCHEQYMILYSEDILVMVMAFETEPKKLTKAIGKLREELAQVIGVAVTIGMGRTYHKAEEIRESFEEAKCAINYKIIKGFNCVIMYEQIYAIDAKPKLIATEDIKRFENCIDNMDDKGCWLVIEDIFRKFENEKNLTPKDLQLLSLNLILSGIRKMSFAQIQLSEYLGKNIFSLESISKFETTTQLKNWIYNTIKSMNELMLKSSVPEKRDIVEEAKDYINKNFNKNISLNEISERFFINPYYFSQLFKKKTGENYQNYLINLRVGRAKKLLEETDLKIYEICELVGYADINHFNKIFERVVGVKPSEYKRNIK